MHPLETADTSSLTLSSRLRRRIEGRGNRAGGRANAHSSVTFDLRYGAYAPTQDEAVWFCSSFRRKPESIFAFAFSFERFTPVRGGAESNTKTKGEFSVFRIRTPRNNKAMAALPGEKSKWIPAFAGMTAVVNSARGGLFQRPPQGGVGGVVFHSRRASSPPLKKFFVMQRLQDFFNKPALVAFDLRRLLRVREEALAVCGSHKRGFSTTTVVALVRTGMEACLHMPGSAGRQSLLHHGLRFSHGNFSSIPGQISRMAKKQIAIQMASPTSKPSSTRTIQMKSNTPSTRTER